MTTPSAAFSSIAAVQWVKGKSADTFAPLGPFLATRDEVPEPGRLGMVESEQEFRQTAYFKNDFRRTGHRQLRERVYDLLPGDVISTGHPPA